MDVPAPTLLVVDDEPPVRASTARILRRYGYTVLEASSGIEALDILGTQPVALLLVDWWLPDMRGEAVAFEARRRDPHPIRVLVLSGSEPAQDCTWPWATKPFRPGELVAKIRALLEAPG